MVYLIKNIRFIILLLILLTSLYFLTIPLLFKPSGVIVTAVSKEVKCSQIKEGDIITQIESVFTKNVVEFKRAVSAVKVDEHVRMIINNGPGWCVGVKNGDIGIDVADVPSNQLKLGIDIQGGTTTTYEPVSEADKLEEVAKTIEKRIEIFRLPETKVELSGNSMKIISLTTEKLSIITAPGKFEAKIRQENNLENKTVGIKIGDNVYPVEEINLTLKINESFYATKEQFVLDGISFDIINITNSSFVTEANIFSNEDVLKVLNEFSYARYSTDFLRYEFNVPLEISKEAINRFEKTVRGLRTSFVGGQMMLHGQVIYYLDGKEISALNIPFEMSSQEITNLAVLGFGNTLTEVTTQKLKIQAVLNSDKLPELELMGMEYYEPSLKSTTIGMLLMGILIISISTGNLMHFRYKKIKFAGHILLLIAAEVFCIVGIAAITQTYYSPGWVLDFPSMLGLLAFLLVSPAQKMLLTEKSLKNNEMSLRYKYKKIMSLATFLNVLLLVVSFALLFTVWKGYGLSMLTGLLISILITTPVYQIFLR